MYLVTVIIDAVFDRTENQYMNDKIPGLYAIHERKRKSAEMIVDSKIVNHYMRAVSIQQASKLNSLCKT